MRWMKVRVNINYPCDAYVPLPDSVPSEEAATLAVKAVEHCDSYGNIQGWNDYDVVFGDVTQERPVGARYIEIGVIRALTDEQLNDLLHESNDDAAIEDSFRSDIRHELKYRGWRQTEPPHPTLRETALAKLTPEEKAALGLTD